MTHNEAIAATTGMDYESERQFKRDYQYQAGKTKDKIFTAGTDYYCMSARKPKGESWKIHPDQFWAEKVNSILWISEC